MPVLPTEYDKLSEGEFVKKYLPSDHNEQDKDYLKKRYAWGRGELDYSLVHEAYQGTTFQLRN